MKPVIACLACLLFAAPAWAQDDARPRLVPGGAWDGALLGESRAPAVSAGGFSLGAVSASKTMPGFSLGATPSLGGYASYSADWLRFSSSLRSSTFGTAADFSAAQSLSALGWGEGSAALSLGYQWTEIGGFSLNPASPVNDGDLGGIGDWSLSLSLTRDITPAFSLGGFAAAGRSESGSGSPASDVQFGAGLELKF